MTTADILDLQTKTLAPEKLARERVVLIVLLADLVVLALMLGVASLTQSLTLIGEMVRIVLMVIVEFVSLLILRMVHRGRVGRLAYGPEKLEQLCYFVLGVALIACGMWVLQAVAALLIHGEQRFTPLGLSIAAVVLGLHTLVSFASYFLMRSVSREDDSPIYRAQLVSRRAKLTASLVVQLSITVAAFANDPLIALWMDAFGGSVVVLIMFLNGFAMAGHALPDLLDAPLPKARFEQLYDAVASVVGEDNIVTLKARRSGAQYYTEATVRGQAFTSPGDTADKSTVITNNLNAQGINADVCLDIV